MPLMNEAGKQYGEWSVIARAPNRGRQTMWLCRCSCGTERSVSGANLRRGHSKSCGCMNKRDLTGQRFERLVVLHEAGQTTSGIRKWLCKCDCGKKTTVAANNLTSGNTRSCGCLFLETVRSDNSTESAFSSLFNRIKNGALKRRGLEFELTKDQVRELTAQNCHYCGALPTQITRRGRSGGKYIYNGLDRKNNSLGYTIDNVVPCCKTCNYAKNKMDYEEFRAWIAVVFDHFANEQ